MYSSKQILKQANILASQAKNAYELSIPILAASNVGNNLLYKQYKFKFDCFLNDYLPKIHGNDRMHERDFKLWMKGRFLLAADMVHDSQKAQNIANELNQALLQQCQFSIMDCWALAYLQTYYAKHSAVYYYQIQSLFNSIIYRQLSDFASNKDRLVDVMWFLAMVWNAASIKGDKINWLYNIHIVNDNKFTFVQLINQTPQHNYSAWLFAVFYEALFKMNERSLLNFILMKLKSQLKKATIQDRMISQSIIFKLKYYGGKTPII